jgi:ribosomal protein S18 acetylase RimI-like enzyme
MRDVDDQGMIEIRSAAAEDVEGITSIFLESAAYHAELDPERYTIPAVESISALYRNRLQHSAQSHDEAITFVAECRGEVVGFTDVRLEQSEDAMHREMTYCHISEIAVREEYRNRGIGARLLQAAEDWGRTMGAEFSSLEFHSENARASSFYQGRLGYRPAAITAIKRL